MGLFKPRRRCTVYLVHLLPFTFVQSRQLASAKARTCGSEAASASRCTVRAAAGRTVPASPRKYAS